MPTDEGSVTVVRWCIRTARTKERIVSHDHDDKQQLRADVEQADELEAVVD